jgi:hypothetical protein
VAGADEPKAGLVGAFMEGVTRMLEGDILVFLLGGAIAAATSSGDARTRAACSPRRHDGGGQRQNAPRSASSIRTA